MLKSIDIGPRPENNGGVPRSGSPEAIYKLIGENLLRLRKERGITQEDLGFSVGMTRGAIANLEKGRQRIFVHQIYKLSDYLGVSIADLLPDPRQVRHLRIVPEVQNSYLATLLDQLEETLRPEKRRNAK